MMTGTIARHVEHDDTIVRVVASWVEAEPGHPAAVNPADLGDHWVAIDGEWPPPGGVNSVVVAAGAGHPDAVPVPATDAARRVSELSEAVSVEAERSVSDDTAARDKRRSTVAKTVAGVTDKQIRDALTALLEGV